MERKVPRLTSLLGALFCLSLAGAALAQPVNDPSRDTVSWAVQPQDARAGGKLSITLRGTVADGWHVYSLQQAPEGPTPLVASIEANAVATANGAVTESKPVKLRDPAFGLDTQFYEHAFTLTVPVRVKPHTSGQQAIPVSVRFQTCNGRICQPPKTVHLSVPVTVKS